MFKHKLVVVTAILTVVMSSVVWVGTSKATAPIGLTSEPITSGSLLEPIRAKFKPQSGVIFTDVTKITMIKQTLTTGGSTG